MAARPMSHQPMHVDRSVVLVRRLHFQIRKLRDLRAMSGTFTCNIYTKVTAQQWALFIVGSKVAKTLWPIRLTGVPVPTPPSLPPMAADLFAEMGQFQNQIESWATEVVQTLISTLVLRQTQADVTISTILLHRSVAAPTLQLRPRLSASPRIP